METFGQKNQYQQYNSNQQSMVKIGKRISKDDLLKYIETNKDAAKNINIIDLNETVSEHEVTSIEKAPFQGIQEIKFLPKKLAKILKINSIKYLHTGCLKTITIRNGKQQTNLQISLLSSIMTCFHTQFSTMTVANQASFIQKLFERLKVDSLGSKFTQFGYNKKYKWHKNDIETELLKCSYDGKVLKYLSDYFHINIFILDIERDQIYYPGDEYVPFKNTIFVLKFEDGIYEPISTQNIRVFTPGCQLINDIRANLDNINVINLGEKMSIGLEEIEEDLTQYLPQEKVKTKHEKQYEIAEREEKEKLSKMKTENKQEYDESINAFSDGENDKSNQKLSLIESDSESDTNSGAEFDTKSTFKLDVKTKSKQDLELEQIEDEKPTKVKKESKIKLDKKTDKSNDDVAKPIYKLSDIKSTLKVDELRTIATSLGIVTNGKTKSVLIDEIKLKLK